MTLFSRSLWSASVKAPYRRMALALVVAPLLLAAVLSVFAFLLSGMSEDSGDEAQSVAIDSAVTLTLVVFAFTWSIALAAIAILWSQGQRGAIAWTLSGMMAGVLGGVLLDQLAIAAGGAPLVIFSAATSAALFLTIRGIAGIREEE